MELIKFKNRGLLDDFFSDSFFNDFLPPASYNDAFIPLGDVIEHDDSFEVQLMLPAHDKKDFKIGIEDDALIIQGERKEVEDVKYNHKQSYFGKFKKTYKLPNNVDRDNIDASYVDGVLKVVISKLEEVKPKHIEVK